MGADLLIVDGDEARRRRLQSALERSGLRAISTSSIADALALLRDEEVGVLVASRAVDADPVEACRIVCEDVGTVPVVVLSERASVNQAVAALRAGASDYVMEGVGPDAVEAAVERLLEGRSLRVHLRELRSETSAGRTAAHLIGASRVIAELRNRVDRVARSEGTVLVTGESGAGKSLVARVLHGSSRRNAGPFVAIDTGALPEQLVESELFGHAKGAFTGAAGPRVGLLVQANGGTILLDQVSGMPLGTQAKLLRALQERKVRPLGDSREVTFDARVIATTNANLEDQVAAGRFREDLYFRLNVLALHVPPLRERERDVLLLAQHFIERFAAIEQKHIVGLTPGAARALLAWRWPGNVRELANWIEAAVIDARNDVITERDLPEDAPQTPPGGPSPADPLDVVELQHIHDVLRSVGGIKSRAAKILGLDRKTLARKLRSQPTGEAPTAIRRRVRGTRG